jgi:L-asparaginase
LGVGVSATVFLSSGCIFNQFSESAQVTAGTIVVLGTGGTIAGTAPVAGDHLGYRAAQLGVAQLLDAIPSLRSLPLATEQVAQLDSKDVTHAVWQQLALRCAHWLAQPEVSGVVVTHGTDTLEETAYFLQAVLMPAKPVVLTCAMRPADALSADGPQNVADAVSVARTPGARGVVAVCAGTVHGADDVSKVHPYRLDAFASNDAGPIGYVEAGRVRLVRPWSAPTADAARPLLEAIRTDPSRWPRVQIVLSHAGADGTVVDALVAAGVDGIVVAGTGNGTLHAAMEAALSTASQRGVRVLRSTRCAQGQVLPHAGDAWPATALSPVKARIALMLELLAAC